jgi:hypothetical protein
MTATHKHDKPRKPYFMFFAFFMHRGSAGIDPGQVRWFFLNVRKAFGSFRRARDCSDYQLDRMKGAAIADPETGSSPGNLLHLTCCNAFWELRDL